MTSYPPPPPGANPPPPPGAPGQQPFGAAAPQQQYGPPPQAYGTPLQQPYGTPPPQQYGAPQPYGAPAPPPHVPLATQEVKAPVVAWLVPLAALLALVGAFTPWFRPKATVSGHSESTTNALYSWEDGRIGLLAPILLVVLAVGVVGLLVGKTPSRFSRGSAHPVATAGKLAVLFGAISLACAAVAWFFVKSQYKFPGPNGSELSWDEFIRAAKQLGVDVKLSQGPQLGYFLTVAASVVAILGGILMVLAVRNAGTTSAGYPPAGTPQGYQPAPTGYAPTPGYPPAGPPAAHQEPPPPSLQK